MSSSQTSLIGCDMPAARMGSAPSGEWGGRVTDGWSALAAAQKGMRGRAIYIIGNWVAAMHALGYMQCRSVKCLPQQGCRFAVFEGLQKPFVIKPNAAKAGPYGIYTAPHTSGERTTERRPHALMFIGKGVSRVLCRFSRPTHSLRMQ